MNILISKIVEKHLKKENLLGEIIWEEIKEKQIFKKEFKQNYPIYFEHNDEKKYLIADFYCPDCNLIIQLDNGIHELQSNYEENSKILIEKFDYYLIQFDHNDINDSLDDAIVRLGERILGSHKRRLINSL